MNIRKQWLYEALKDIPGIDPAILKTLMPKTPAATAWSLSDHQEHGKRYPRRNGADFKTSPDVYPGLLIRRIGRS